MIRAENDRRWKLVSIHPNDILGLFLDWNYTDCFAQIRIKGIPSDYIIDSVEYSVLSQSWEVLIYHENFEIVPYGAIPPRLFNQCVGFYLPKCKDREEAYVFREKPRDLILYAVKRGGEYIDTELGWGKLTPSCLIDHYNVAESIALSYGAEVVSILLSEFVSRK